MKNRDIPKLADLLPTMQLVNATERRLDWQHDRINSMQQHITGMPGGSALPAGLEDVFAKLCEAGEAHEKGLRQYLADLRETERILNGIKSRELRAFVVMKYVFDATDAEIRRELNMSEYRMGKARQAVEEAENMKAVIWKDRYSTD